MLKLGKLKSLAFSQGGITYVEVLTTTLVLAVVIGSSIAVFGKCNVFANEIRHRSVVDNILNEEMEEIRNIPYNNLASGQLANAGLNNLRNGTCALILDDPFSNPNIRRATVTVSWVSPEGRALTKSLSALISRIGVSN